MKYSTALCGKKPFSSPYSCAARVLLWESTSVGRPKFLMTFAIVIVFSDPVTPSRVWNRSPRSSPFVSSAIALGWSPAGSKGARRSNAALAILYIAGQPLAPRDLGHAFHASGCFQNLLKVGKVADFYGELTDHVAVRAVQLEASDIGARRRNGGGKVGIKSAAVRRLQRQPHHELLTFQLFPIYLEPALRLLDEHEKVWTIRAVNADSPTSCYIPHNGVSGYGLATLGVADHHPIDTLNPDALRSPADAIHQPVERTRLWRIGRGLGVGVQLPHDLRDVHIALPNGRDQMVQVGQVERFGHLQEISIFRLCQ